MKTRPILFSADMVRAILEGRKTQTRRTMKTQPTKLNAWEPPDERGKWGYHIEAGSGGMYFSEREALTRGALAVCPCPFGEPGDRLYVRETACIMERTKGVIYKATCNNPDVWRWTPSIHMPKWASRITLEVERVWVERVQDISEADAIAEGLKNCPNAGIKGGGWAFPGSKYDKAGLCHRSPETAFYEGWEAIYGSWADNPWVWACSFKVVEQGATK